MLLSTTSFGRLSKRYGKWDRAARVAIDAALAKLEDNPDAPELKTHERRGRFGEVWPCIAAYDLRIMFKYTTHGGDEAILLLAVGTHDELYRTFNR